MEARWTVTGNASQIVILHKTLVLVALVDKVTHIGNILKEHAVPYAGFIGYENLHNFLKTEIKSSKINM